MKLKRFDWHPPAVGTGWAAVPPAVVVHRRRGRVVLRHGGDETCDLCQEVAAKAAQAPARLHTDNTRSGWTEQQEPPQERAPFTPFSGRMYRGYSLEEAISMPEKVRQERNRRT